VALQVLNAVHGEVPGLEVTWLCQSRPQLEGVAFKVHCVVDPSQAKVRDVYAAGHQVLLFTSRHEAWAMPVLEAMAVGVPVVTTRCYGVDDYCVHLGNCLMAPALDWSLLAQEVLSLLANRALAARLATNARRTAERLSWARAGDCLEVALYRTAHYFRRQRDPPPPRAP